MIKVVDKVFDILELLATDPEQPRTLSAIADPLQMNHGTCANLLKTMAARHYVQRLPFKKGYRLGIKAYQLSGKKKYKSELIKIARQAMTDLTNLVNENSLLAVLEGNQRVALVRISCQHAVQVITPAEKDAYDSSTGRLLIAMQDDEELDQFIQRYGLPPGKNGRPVSRTAFMQEAERLRREKCCIWLPDDQIMGIAVPVYKDNAVVASLSVYAPAYRCSERKKKTILKELVQAARHISDNLAGA